MARSSSSRGRITLSSRSQRLPRIGAALVDFFLGAADLPFLPVWVLHFPLASMQLPYGLV